MSVCCNLFAKSLFDEECLYVLDERNNAKMQWIQDPSQNNVDNLNNVRLEATRHFRNKKKAYLKAKLRNLKLTVISRILGTCVGVSVTLRRVTGLELV